MDRQSDRHRKVMRFIFPIIAAFIALSLPSLAGAETRIALVIGNGAYQHLPTLKNPPNDARDLAEALKLLDFDVDFGADLTLADMQRRVTAFAKRAQAADVALAFFAGHGVQAADPLGSSHPVNYLLPIDADIKEEADLGFLLTARDIVARLQAASGVRILILDACRDNPIPQRLARGRGAAPRGLSPEPKTGGTLIAYSTQPGTVAGDGDDANSPFMKALLAHIADPGLDIRLLFADVRREVSQRSHGAQTPETSDSLEGRFAFKAAAVTAAPEPPPVTPSPVTATPATALPVTPPPVTPQAPAGPLPDEVAWSIVKDTRQVEELRRFIEQYPASGRRHDAEARLGALQQTAMTVPAHPAEPQGPRAASCSSAAAATPGPRAAAPLTAAEECSLRHGSTFRECAGCPEMVVVPPGSFTMGSPEIELGRMDSESPQHVVRIARRLAVGAAHVTVDQFAAFAGETGYAASTRCVTGNAQAGSWRNPGFKQDGSHPAVCIDWADAKAYVDWLAARTGRPYRLLAEAEWEYASRGRTQPGIYPRLWPGPDAGMLCRYGNGLDQRGRGILWRGLPLGVMPCDDGYLYTSPAGHYAPNAFGLHDMFGNARQWTADCWHTSYTGAPSDGSAWASPGPCAHVIRGGAWSTIMRDLRSASRHAGLTVDNTYGFRVARTLAALDRTADDSRAADAPAADAAAHGWAGLRIQTITRDNMNAFGVRDARGAAVLDAQPGGPAARAGLETGDVIVAVNGRDIADAPDLARTISALSPGATARLTVIRNGQGRTVSMTVGAPSEQQ
jgi:formylglycine-generating enzyme required for sulfatase activity